MRSSLAWLLPAAGCVAGASFISDSLLASWALVTAGFVLAGLGTRGPARTSLLVMLLLIGAAARLPYMLAHPESSDDIYRYVFEGRVWADGENPFYFPPDSPRLAHLRDDVIHPRINNQELATIYPPAAHGLFVLAHFAGGTILSWKALLLALELAAAILLGRHQMRHGKSLLAATLFFWNPLLIFESAEGGHVDAAGASMVLLALCIALSQRPFRASLLAIAACLVKPVPGPLLLLFCRGKRGLSGLVAGGIIAAGALCLALMPPGNGVWKPTEQGVARCADGRASIHFSDSKGTRIVEDRPGSLQFEPGFHPRAAQVLGRYHLGVFGVQHQPLLLTFDGGARVLVEDDEAASFYVDDTGFVVIFDRESNRTIARLQMSRDRAVLKGRILEPFAGFPGPGDAVALKGAESPLMSWSLYLGRWEGFAPIHNAAMTLFGSRKNLGLAEAVLLVLLAIGLYLTKAPLAGSSLGLAAIPVLLTPVLYPWYLMWLLPGAVLLQRPAVRIFFASLLAAAPLMHLAPV